MISLFDAGDEPGVPVDLVTRGRRSVSLLEFVAFPAPVLVEDDRGQAFVVDERAVQVAAMVEAARDEAMREVREACEAEMEERLALAQARVTKLVSEFASGRQKYFASAEEQVVRLALAVARRVLQREVNGEGLHLEAAVRAALARVSDGSRSLLRVNAFEAASWNALLGKDVEVVGEERMNAGECVLETSVGRVELGVEVQMGEVERAFGELLARQGA